jgi:hypothetical protein
MGNCKRIGNKMVCGMLHGGGTANRDGLFRLAKGERVFSPLQLKHISSKGKKKCKSKCAKKKGKKCSCKKK